MGEQDAGDAVEATLQRSGLLGRLEAERTDEAEERRENLVELVAAAREFDEQLAEQPPSHDPDEPVPPPPLARFLEQIALLGEADAETPEGRVALMTLHAAKGLEFDAVFLAGLEDGTLPHERPWDDVTASERLGRRRRGAAALLRGHDPGQAAAHALAGEAAHELRRGRGDLPRHGAVALPGRPAAGAVRPGGGAGRPAGAARPVHPAPPRRAARRAAHRGGRRGDLPPRRRPGRRGAAGEGPTIDYDFDQRPDAAARPFTRGDTVVHEVLGEGKVLACDGAGREAKVTVHFWEAGEKRVLARFLQPASRR